MKTGKKSVKLCEKCGSQNLKTCLRTYPLQIEAKQLNVERVSVKECMDCYHLEPTIAGEKKILRCMGTFMMLFFRDD